MLSKPTKTTGFPVTNFPSGTFIRDMIKGLVAPNNEDRSKESNIWIKELLEKRVSEARATSTNSARRGLHRKP